LLTEADDWRRAGPARAIGESARAAGPRPVRVVTAVRSPGTDPREPGIEPPGGRPATACRGDLARAAERLRLSRVCLGCISVAVWVFVRFERSFLLFGMYGDGVFTFKVSR